MRVFFIVFLLIVSVFSCAPTKYFVKSEADLTKVNWETNRLNYIPLKDVFLENSRVLDSTYTLITLRKFSKLKRYLSSNSTMSSEVYLAWAFYYVAKAKYQKAYLSIEKVEDDKFDFVKQLLLIDLKYEFYLQNDENEYNNVLQKYQVLMDKYINNKFVKEIISMRSRYLRYSL